MAFTVTMQEIYQAAPTLSKMAVAKLSPIGAMRVSQVMAAVDTAINAFENDRVAALKRLALSDDDGNIIFHPDKDAQGKDVNKASFPTPEAEKEMEDYGNELLRRGVRIPFRIKTKHLTTATGGYALTVQECKNLGRFLSYDDLPPELDETLEEGDK